MPSLQQTIAALASSFTQEVLLALRGVSMADLSEFTSSSTPSRSRSGGAVKKSAPAKAASSKAASSKAASSRPARKAKGGRLARRSSKELANAVEKIVGLLKGKKDGLRAEQIRAALGMVTKEMPRPLQQALAKKLIRRKGQKRATTYFAA